MPDKRQESKQRRAARNRANREALAARRDNAVASPTVNPPTSSDASKGAAGKAAAGAGPSAASAAPPLNARAMLASRRTGDRAVLAALLLAVVAAIYLLFYRVPADDRGEALPAVFRGLAVAARERVTGQPMPDNTVSLLDASGPQIFLVLALPVAVAVFAVWANRRPDRGRMLTFAMLAMAGAVILTGGIGIFFFPALIALAVAGFRVRKADLPARVAERSAASGGRAGRSTRGRGAVIEADSQDVTDADSPADESSADTDEATGPATGRSRRRRGARSTRTAEATGADEVQDTGLSDGEAVHEAPDAPGIIEVDAPVDAPAQGTDEVDPLAELEAEIEAERAASAAEGDAGSDDAGGQGRTGRSRRKR